MSSVCSINSCTSPDVTSSNVSSNKINESANNDASNGRLRTTVPEVKKDNKYWERRRRNNEAARRSREKRRMNDMNMDNRIMELSQRNKQLEHELYQIKVCGSPPPNTHSLNNLETNIKKSKLTPIIPATADSNNKEKIQTTQLNGMVFPIFTTIKPVINNSDISESKETNGFSNSSSGFQITVPSDSNRFQTNLLTFSNIPLLSSLIATTANYGDDIVTKPTLLLPPFQIPSKTVDATNGTDTIPDLVGDDQFQSEFCKGSTDSPTIKTSAIKTESHDILDLRIKHENEESFFTVPDGFSSGFDSAITASQVDEPINNSFLSGSVQSNHCKDQSPASVLCNQTCDRYGYNTPRRQRFSGDQNVNYHRRHRKEPFDNLISLRSRLQIREEVANVVSKENEKLHETINGLADEIKGLKSVVMSIAASSVTNQLRLKPIIERLKCQPQDNVGDIR